MDDRDPATFDAWVRTVEPRLRRSLMATYGIVDGREATVDALSWAWEHWDRARSLDNPVAYLYRVGQSATRRFSATATGDRLPPDDSGGLPDFDPKLLPALAELDERQRTIVVLVEGYRWSQQEVAEILGLSPSTVHAHRNRALARLRLALGGSHVPAG